MHIYDQSSNNFTQPLIVKVYLFATVVPTRCVLMFRLPVRFLESASKPASYCLHSYLTSLPTIYVQHICANILNVTSIISSAYLFIYFFFQFPVKFSESLAFQDQPCIEVNGDIFGDKVIHLSNMWRQRGTRPAWLLKKILEACIY